MRPMQLLDQFNDVLVANKLSREIKAIEGRFSLMEVCGTHTVQIFKLGIKDGLSERIKLLSGPGCPVCVTSIKDIDTAIEIAKSHNIIFCCFGDMLKVPGSRDSLDTSKGKYDTSVKLIYSPLDGLNLAKQFPNKKIVLFGVGFETTVPAFASVLIRARNENIKNLFIYPAFKLIPPAIRVLLDSKLINIDGFILPGHVSTIIGEAPYSFIADEYNKPAVITGFELIDILEGIMLLIKMIRKKEAKVKNEYRRSVESVGNKLALEKIYSVFQECDVEWRGLGRIKNSGLELNEKFNDFHIGNILKIKIGSTKENPKCLCGNVIKGVSLPKDCLLFASECTPEHPIGPCMVSGEGTCSTYFKYSKR